MMEEETSECLPRLEANFCKDFSCCGINLPNLHDLVQHYEDSHADLEEDDNTVPAFEQHLPQQPQHQMHQQQQYPYHQHQQFQQLPQTQSSRPKYDIEAMKRRARMDFHFHLGQGGAQYPASLVDDEDVAFDDFAGYGDAFQSRKRSWRPSMSTPSVVTRDFFTPNHSPQSTPASSIPSTPTMAVSHDFTGEGENPLLFGPPSNSTDWLTGERPQFSQIKKVRQNPPHQGYSTPEMMSPPQVIAEPGSNLVVVEKPYKCPVPGCDKAYKNQNGLKYHKMHGNCAANPIAFAAAQASGQPVTHMVQENKPYSCSSCAKRYKNLNGLKYHLGHSHQHVTTDSVLKAIQASGNSQVSAIW